MWHLWKIFLFSAGLAHTALQLMFAPIFCGQVVSGGGLPGRGSTRGGEEGGPGVRRSVPTVWPGQRAEAPPSVAGASVVVSVSSGAWCRLTFTDICTWTADYSHRERSRGGGFGGLEGGLVRECGHCFWIPWPSPSSAGLCLVLCIPVFAWMWVVFGFGLGSLAFGMGISD